MMTHHIVAEHYEGNKFKGHKVCDIDDADFDIKNFEKRFMDESAGKHIKVRIVYEYDQNGELVLRNLLF